MAEKPRWQLLQEEWNSLVPTAQAAGIPRIRAVKLGPESIKYREDKLATLRSQLTAAGATVANPQPAPGGAESWTLRGMSEMARTAWAGLGSGASLRHDLPLLNFDITVEFQEGPPEVLRGQARDILSAIRLCSLTPCREWPAEKLQSIKSITWRTT